MRELLTPEGVRKALHVSIQFDLKMLREKRPGTPRAIRRAFLLAHLAEWLVRTHKHHFSFACVLHVVRLQMRICDPTFAD